MRLFPRADGYEAEKISNRGDLHMSRVVYDFTKPKRRSSAIIQDTGTMEDLMGGDGPITKLWELYDKTMESLKQEDPLTLQERIDGLEESLRSQTEENRLLTSKSKLFWATDRLSLSWNKRNKEIHFCLGRSIRGKQSDKNQLFRMELIINAPYHDQLEPTTEQPEETEETKYDSGSVIIKEEPTTPPVTLTSEASLIASDEEDSKKTMLSTSISSSTPSGLPAHPSFANAAEKMDLTFVTKSSQSP
jgi:hypothetical protein